MNNLIPILIGLKKKKFTDWEIKNILMMFYTVLLPFSLNKWTW